MKALEFCFPADCVMLMDAAGVPGEGGLTIQCVVNASPGRNLTINGVPCYPSENQYRAKIVLKDFKNTVAVLDMETGEREAITVYYLKTAHKKYRFSLDDNIWCLQNIAKNQHIYKSIFEDPYFKLLKTMNDRYGTKFHMNIYYECPEFGGFNLTQMPDKYKAEWKANSDWLRLSFHANANLPDKPYVRGTFAQTKFEHDRVMDQILRFAGEEAFAGPVTTIHWGDATVETVRAMRSSGIRAMVGTFQYAAPGGASIKYHLNAEQCALMNVYGFWYDRAEDMVFFKYGGGPTQHGALEELHPGYNLFCKQHPLYTFREICLHEQYFYPHYKGYMPDYYDRFDTAIRWAVENGYEPSFVADLIEFDKL
ncbi:MAG: hypothetical protein E7292_10245 [Lachnospiraceae bacterium]|nr:hypothetical protein [Lachnospiraceae bacterium]